jgi:hypothetical protein
LYTSSPGDKAVKQTTIYIPINNVIFSNEKNVRFLHKLPIFQIHDITGIYSKPSTLWTIPASLVVVVFCRLLFSHGTV